MNDLTKVYAEWRLVTEQEISEGMGGSVDCGESSVRSDFSAYAELSETITFDDMFELEKGYEGK